MPSREARGGGRREGHGQGGVRYIIRNTVRRRFPNFFKKKFLRSDTESAEGHRNSESKKEEGEEKGEAAAEGEEVDGQKKTAGLGAR